MAKGEPSKETNLTIVNRIKNTIRHHPRRSFELLFFVLTSLFIFACLTLVFAHQGWPQNHEGLSFVMRSKIYADHFLQGDFFPIWSSSDAYGMGTPLPLYYHKTFYYISGLALALFGSAKLAIWLTVALFMYVGAYGMRRCLEVLKTQKSLVIMAVVLLLLSNYLFSNWLVRGAMAEFSAMMLIPWLLWWCLNVVKNQKLSFWIVPIFYLLFQAHNITALFSLILLGVACAIYITKKRKKAVVPLAKFVAIAAGVLFLLLLPQVLLQVMFLRDYDPSKITQMGYMASDNFRGLDSYVGSGYVWLRNWQELNISLDVFVWATIVAGMAVYMLRFVRDKYWRDRRRMTAIDPAAALLIVCLGAYLFFQSPTSKAIYESVAPLQFLQFPWRLLSYITPIAILLSAITIGWMTRRHKTIQYSVAGVVVVATLLASPIGRHYQYGFFTTDIINKKIATKDGGLESDLSGIGEYLPKVYDKSGRVLSTSETTSLYREIAGHKTTTASSPCTVTKVGKRQRFEDMRSTFRVECLSPGDAYLPISYNTFSKVSIVNGKSITSAPVKRVNTDPRMAVYVSSTQPQEVVVELPRLFR